MFKLITDIFQTQLITRGRTGSRRFWIISFGGTDFIARHFNFPFQHSHWLLLLQQRKPYLWGSPIKQKSTGVRSGEFFLTSKCNITKCNVTKCTSAVIFDFSHLNQNGCDVGNFLGTPCIYSDICAAASSLLYCRPHGRVFVSFCQFWSEVLFLVMSLWGSIFSTYWWCASFVMGSYVACNVLKLLPTSKCCFICFISSLWIMALEVGWNQEAVKKLLTDKAGLYLRLIRITSSATAIWRSLLNMRLNVIFFYSVHMRHHKRLQPDCSQLFFSVLFSPLKISVFLKKIKLECCCSLYRLKVFLSFFIFFLFNRVCRYP